VSEAMRQLVALVRLFLRDYPELNRLVCGEESSDRQIAWAILDALSDFNGTPPFTTYALEDLLARNLHHLLMRMTAITLIESVGLLQSRNHINYSAGGVTVGVSDKTPLLLTWLQYFQAKTEQMKVRAKVALNIEGLLTGGSPSGLHSEYWAVHMTYAPLLS
jgi:hypothetical protein